MYDAAFRRTCLQELEQGSSLSTVSRRHGVTRSTLREWRDNPENVPPIQCPQCQGAPLAADSYSHLLGLYLGDGCLSACRRGVYMLRISCDARYRRLVAEAVESISLVRPGVSVFKVTAPGVTFVQAYWKHWPCLFPQHGPGRKHERPIVLEDWQVRAVDEHPGPFLRGLFHSDGCRVTNWTVRPLRAGPKRYEYPRYFFSNQSADIIGICTRTLDRLGIAWTMPRYNTVSVARRASVTLMDELVGPKS
jgi:hypothetical protein